MKEKKMMWIRYTICFGVVAVLCYLFPYTGDDWAWGSQIGIDRLNQWFENDPFAKLDQAGVGKLMKMAIDLGKPVRPSLHVGICGEHGGDPKSIAFCNAVGLQYVSCSPFRVPIARLAAAQAVVA